jgi:hypothetical protein
MCSKTFVILAANCLLNLPIRNLGTSECSRFRRIEMDSFHSGVGNARRRVVWLAVVSRYPTEHPLITTVQICRS